MLPNALASLCLWEDSRTAEYHLRWAVVRPQFAVAGAAFSEFAVVVVGLAEEAFVVVLVSVIAEGASL